MADLKNKPNTGFITVKRLLAFAVVLLAIVHGVCMRADEVAGFPGGYISIFVAFVAPFVSPFVVLRALLIPHELESAFSIPVLKNFLVPRHPFDENEHVVPDYRNEEENWASLPWITDCADMVPPACGAIKECGAVPNDNETEVDLFYVSPTTFYDPRHWNQKDLADPFSNYIQDEAILPQQAAAFNSHTRIYSPRYRQMTGFAYFAEEELTEHRISATDLAYSDVKRAFEHYLEHWNNGRPFMLASHSQGSEHILRLLKDVISSNEDLKAKMITAYVVGMPVYMPLLEEWGLNACEHRNDTNCVISWQTYVDSADNSLFYFQPSTPELRRPTPDSEQLCTNPLSWLSGNGEYVPKTFNLGAMHPIQWFQNLYFLLGPDEGTRREKQNARITNSLLGLSANLVGAQCKDGALMVDSPPFSETDSSPMYTFFPVWYFATFPAGNLHPMDYNLFWMNVRENSKERIQAYMSKVRL